MCQTIENKHLTNPNLPNHEGVRLARRRHHPDSARDGSRINAYLAVPDESHGFTRPESEMVVYRAIEIFLHEHIGGRVGEQPTQVVPDRLEELRSVGVANSQQER